MIVEILYKFDIFIVYQYNTIDDKNIVFYSQSSGCTYR